MIPSAFGSEITKMAVVHVTNLIRLVVYALDVLTISKHKDLCVPIFESAYAERTPTADLEGRSLDRSITRLAPVCQPYEVCDVDNGHMC